MDSIDKLNSRLDELLKLLDTYDGDSEEYEQTFKEYTATKRQLSKLRIKRWLDGIE